MSDNNRIEVGDLVVVEFVYHGQRIRGVVLSVPAATGDSWIIRQVEATEENGPLHYVQLFESMRLVMKEREWRAELAKAAEKENP